MERYTRKEKAAGELAVRDLPKDLQNFINETDLAIYEYNGLNYEKEYAITFCGAPISEDINFFKLKEELEALKEELEEPPFDLE